ncbi:uncharacterized protein LOC119069693 [Bradysia coprophila]|uniref:uncharacterized protein LOC119069693 n=1 Tax=Bradysia coprophila TaxID=38358 RepID=UPI00187DD696|nr:uncharacterized protein LOC119069693 [Bradysia coprophila]
MATCKIKEVIPLSSGTNNPTIAYFEHGDILPEGAKSFNCRYAENMDDGSRLALATTDANVYFGKIDHGFATDLQRTFIAIRNKTTNKVRLIEVNQCTMLSQHFDRYTASTGQITGRNLEDIQKMSLDTFGSKRAKRMFGQKAKNNYNPDLVKDQLEATLAEHQNKEPEVEDEFDKKRMMGELFLESRLPKVNKMATKISEIYQLDDLIDMSLLSRMDEEALAVLNIEDFTEDFKIPFIIEALNAIKRSKEPDSSQNLTKVKVCIYLDALINFLSGIKKRNNMKREDFSFVTTKVEADIRSKFVSPHDQKLGKSKYTVHKVSSYIIVLSFFISDLKEVSMDEMMQALESSKVDILKICTSIAVKYRNTSNKLVLQLPSKTPTPKK